MMTSMSLDREHGGEKTKWKSERQEREGGKTIYTSFGERESEGQDRGPGLAAVT